MLTALVPPSFVPTRMAMTWRAHRADVVVAGGLFFLLGFVVYALA
jgi:hypothetical protein